MLTITGAIVIFAMLWFLTLFCMLPQRMKSQADHGEVVPGTPASAPEVSHLKAKFIWTTVIAAALWCLIVAVLAMDLVALEDVPLWQLPDDTRALAHQPG